MNITSTSDGILFEILVKPMSKNCRITIINNEVTFFSKKPAYKGKANKDLIKVLSHLFRRKVKIIFGLGNPGRQYNNNRHNVGYKVLESLASSQNLEFKRSFRTSSYIAKKKDPGGWVFLVKPRTFMNNSGSCAKKILNKYKVNLAEILVVYDDTDLPLGKIRFRARGSCAGHRGMTSIVSALASEEVNRLKVGIGSPQNQQLSDYVLSDFSKMEAKVLNSVVSEAVAASWDWANKGIDFSMQKYNRRGG